MILIRKFLYPLAIIVIVLASCKSEEDQYLWKTIEVTASAYNSVPSQTDGLPNVAAWGDTLVPGTKSIAVSRDLIRLGLTRNTPVKIEGFEGTYFVRDKMHSKWRNRIDIYMGTDVAKARVWGRKKLSIQYAVKKDSTNSDEAKK